MAEAAENLVHRDEVLEAEASMAAKIDWRVAHNELVRLARARAGLDFDEGCWLLLALRSASHTRLGYGSFVEYVERLFGYSPRLTHDKLRVAEALEQLPQLGQALAQGSVCWSVLRELTRVATPETEREWLTAARGRTARDVEQLVSGRRPGDRPGDPMDLSAQRHVLRFEVAGDVLASFREALAKIRRDAGGPLDDDAALLLMARQVLAGPKDEGRSSYQVALTVCERCRSATQHGRGQPVEVTPEVVEMAHCDAQQLGGLQHCSQDATHVGSSTRDESLTHVGASTRVTHVGRSKRPARATQDVPPALRRQVLRRDRHCCVFPGCRHAMFLDLHHLERRADGGAHELYNLVTVCSAHHRALHRGDVAIERAAGTGDLRFRHADGTDYGGVAATPAAAADARALAFRGLRSLGFGESEVKRALAQVAARSKADATAEQLLRDALRLLSDATLRSAPAARST